MRGKLLFVTGAAVGYVLGTRAGRKRYEQIKSAATKVWESPGIQKQVNAVEDFVAARVGDVPGVLYEGAKKLVVQAADRQKNQSSTRVVRTETSPAAPAAPGEPTAAPTAATKTAPAKPKTAGDTSA
jgi:hypothetical protein